MGMFDYIFVDTNKLPLSEKEKDLLPDKMAWQTKDFKCFLDKIIIEEDGQLTSSIYELDYTPDPTSPFGFCMNKKNEVAINLDYTGGFEFGEIINNIHYQFEGIAEKGIVKEIKLLSKESII